MVLLDSVRRKWPVPYHIFATLSLKSNLFSSCTAEQSVVLRSPIHSLSHNPVFYWKLANFLCHLVLCQMKFSMPYILLETVPGWRAIGMATCLPLGNWIPITITYILLGRLEFDISYLFLDIVALKQLMPRLLLDTVNVVSPHALLDHSFYHVSLGTVADWKVHYLTSWSTVC